MPGRGDRGGKKEKPRDARKSLLRILSYLNDYRWAVIILTLCAFISNFGNLLGPSFAGKAIHAAGAGAGKVDFDVVFFYGKCMLAAYLASGLLTFVINIGMMRVSRKVVRKMRKDVFDKLMTLPVGFFDRNQAGDIISRVSYDIDVVGTSLATDVVQIITSVVTVVGSFLMMCVISLPMVVCMLVTIPMAICYTAIWAAGPARFIRSEAPLTGA